MQVKNLYLLVFLTILFNIVDTCTVAVLISATCSTLVASLLTFRKRVFNFSGLSIKYPEAELYERVRKTPGRYREMLLTF